MENGGKIERTYILKVCMYRNIHEQIYLSRNTRSTDRQINNLTRPEKFVWMSVAGSQCWQPNGGESQANKCSEHKESADPPTSEGKNTTVNAQR